jgi:hypothetical protein
VLARSQLDINKTSNARWTVCFTKVTPAGIGYSAFQLH